VCVCGFCGVHDRVRPGFPTNTLAVVYSGEEPELAWPQQLTLDKVRPWLEKWGYE